MAVKTFVNEYQSSRLWKLVKEMKKQLYKNSLAGIQ